MGSGKFLKVADEGSQDRQWIKASLVVSKSVSPTVDVRRNRLVEWNAAHLAQAK